MEGGSGIDMRGVLFYSSYFLFWKGGGRTKIIFHNNYFSEIIIVVILLKKSIMDGAKMLGFPTMVACSRMENAWYPSRIEYN